MNEGPAGGQVTFSKLKAHLRRFGARPFNVMCDAIAHVCDLYSPQECWNYFKAAGYVSSQWRDVLILPFTTPIASILVVVINEVASGGLPRDHHRM